jgi:hypothetical protein
LSVPSKYGLEWQNIHATSAAGLEREMDAAADIAHRVSNRQCCASRQQRA